MNRLFWLPACLLVACGRDAEVANASAPVPPVAVAEPAHAPQLARNTDERYLAAVRALEAGDLAAAKQSRLAAPEGLDQALLGARLRAAEGDGVAAVRAIEAARASWPDQGRVFATAAEIHAVAGRFESAEDEIRAGLAAGGPSPDLSRARGVLALARKNAGRVALEHLLAARAADPGLEFSARPLAQAHTQLAQHALSEKNAQEAAAHARAAVEAYPTDREARRTLAEALAGAGLFDESLALYEALLAEGEPVGVDLSWTALHGATAALVERDRPKALVRYQRALELGLPRSELGFGATVLAEAATARVDAGLAAYEKGELAAARAEFEAALALDPDALEAHNHLAVVLFRQDEFAAAAEHWSRVLALAQARELTLPEPVHLNLARALHKAGRSAEITPLLDEYLEREPNGAFADATRDMLARLAVESRGGK